MPILLNIDHDAKVTPELEAYWTALGRFIHRFARLEQQVAYMLALYAKTPKGTAQAVFSGTRAAAALSLIDRIREAREMPDDKDWNRAKAQFGVINSVRNDIVHFGAIEFPDGGLKVSTANRTLPRQAKVTPVSAAQLDAMTSDVRGISETFYAHQLIEIGNKPEDRNVIAARERGRVPWKYKPPQQAPAQGKRRGKKDKQKVPQKSS